MDFTMLLLFAAIFVIAYLIFRVIDLKKLVKNSEDVFNIAIKDHVKAESVLRGKLTEATDKVASLQVVIINQGVTIKHHEQIIEECAKIVEKKPEVSTQYPVAPPDMTKPVSKKKYWNRGKGGKFVKNS